MPLYRYNKTKSKYTKLYQIVIINITIYLFLSLYFFTFVLTKLLLKLPCAWYVKTRRPSFLIMKSPIKTLETKIHGLKIELRTWSDPRNFNQRIIDECNQEIKEHEEVLKRIKSWLM